MLFRGFSIDHDLLCLMSYLMSYFIWPRGFGPHIIFTTWAQLRSRSSCRCIVSCVKWDEKSTGRPADWPTGRHADRYKQANTNKEAEAHTHREINRQTKRQTNKQTNKQTHKQADKHADRLPPADRHVQTGSLPDRKLSDTCDKPGEAI